MTWMGKLENNPRDKATYSANSAKFKLHMPGQSRGYIDSVPSSKRDSESWRVEPRGRSNYVRITNEAAPRTFGMDIEDLEELEG